MNTYHDLRYPAAHTHSVEGRIRILLEMASSSLRALDNPRTEPALRRQTQEWVEDCADRLAYLFGYDPRDGAR
ncbi:hypothetical protein AB0O91_21835 [Kitasatospora sp. NPDC089797]|uniref:hypothetical protein n=1 Tax=Kitasatospora sp. NPDC089797 TaxID=3155298 RepID=UPI00341D0217